MIFKSFPTSTNNLLLISITIIIVFAAHSRIVRVLTSVEMDDKRRVLKHVRAEDRECTAI